MKSYLTHYGKGNCPHRLPAYLKHTLETKIFNITAYMNTGYVNLGIPYLYFISISKYYLNAMKT